MTHHDMPSSLAGILFTQVDEDNKFEPSLGNLFRPVLKFKNRLDT